MDKGKKFTRMTISLPRELLEEIDRFCEEHGYTRSELVRVAVRRFMNLYELSREEVGG